MFGIVPPIDPNNKVRKRMKLATKCFVVLASATLIAGGLTLSSPRIESAAAAIVGGLDLNGYCKQAYGSSYSVALYWNNINGWHCVSGGLVKGVYLSQACSLRWGTWKFGYRDFNNPYTIFCYA